LKTMTRPLLLSLLILMVGCAPKVGSEAWCKAMADKDKGDWTANEAADFASNCIFKTYDED
jgi:hypothetical protein